MNRMRAGNPATSPLQPFNASTLQRLISFVVQKLFFAKIAFSGFLLGNHQNLGFAATSNPSHYSAKIPGCAKSKGKRKKEKGPETICANERQSHWRKLAKFASRIRVHLRLSVV